MEINSNSNSNNNGFETIVGNDNIVRIKSDDDDDVESNKKVVEDTPSTDEDDSDSDESPKKCSLEEARSPALRPFVIISSSYLLFTITDGALRMIVLLHAYNKSFSAFEVALMFTLYELAGVVTNLVAGLMGAKWGIKVTLLCGLSLQLVCYGLLFGWQDDWSKETAIIYVTIAQMWGGVAKDLTKLGGKTVTKLVTPSEQETKLFKLVSFITGWKNSLKGVGYFLGSALLQISYETSLIVLISLVVLAMPWAIFGLDKNLGISTTEEEENKPKKTISSTLKNIFVLNNRNLNLLSLARLFLFASRDFWFEVPLPFFFRSPSCEGLSGEERCAIDDVVNICGTGAICGVESGFCENINVGGGCGGLGLERVVVGAILGGFIILYGQVQSWTPQLVTGPLNQTPPNKLTQVLWCIINCLPTGIMAAALTFDSSFHEDRTIDGMTSWFVVLILTFAFVFAVNSSIHSFLVVNYSEGDKVAVSVGFYYMSNACGRLFGTLGSGLLYTYVGENIGPLAGTDAVAGLAACFLAGTICSIVSAIITLYIDDQNSGLHCGPCCTIVQPTSDDEEEENESNTNQKKKNTTDEKKNQDNAANDDDNNKYSNNNDDDNIEEGVVVNKD